MKHVRKIITVCNAVPYSVYVVSMAITMIAMLIFMITIYFDKLSLEDQLAETQADLLLADKEVQRPKLHISDPNDISGVSLSVKNKNLLNVKALENGKWKGQIGTDKFGHAVFKDWEHGIRAASYVLNAYAKNHQIDTITALVHRFCTGNHTAYIRYLCKNLGVTKEQKIDLIAYMPKLLRYMAKFESGRTLPERLFVPYDIVAKL